MHKRKKILLKALLFSSFLLCGVKPAPQTMYIGSRVSMALTPQAQENSVFLKKLLRRTDEVFKKPPHIHRPRHYLTIYPGASRMQFRARKNKWILYLPGNARNWKRDAGLRKTLYLVFWSAVCGFSAPQQQSRLPDWIAAGCDEMLLREQDSEKLMRSNRHFPAAAALLDARLPLPDFRQLPMISQNGLSPAELSWFREFSRLLLLILKEDNLAFQVLCDSLEMSRPVPWHRFYEQGKTGSAGVLRERAMRIVRHDLAPASGEWLLKEQAVWEKLEYPELNERGIPTGVMLTARLAEFPELCRTRPDAPKLRKILAGKVNTFAKNASLDVKLLCGEMALAAQRFGVEKNALQDFLALQEKLTQLLKQRSKEEQALAKQAACHLPPQRSSRLRLKELQNGRNALSAEEQKILLERERAYRAE